MINVESNGFEVEVGAALNSALVVVDNGVDVLPSYVISNKIDRAKRWIEEQEYLEKLQAKNEKLEEENKINAPKVEFHDTYHRADVADLEMEAAAKVIGLGLHEFYAFLRWGKVFYKNLNKNLPQERYCKDGCFVTEVYTYEIKDKWGNKKTQNGTKVYVTPKGMSRLGKYYNTKYQEYKKYKSKV